MVNHQSVSDMETGFWSKQVTLKFVDALLCTYCQGAGNTVMGFVLSLPGDHYCQFWTQMKEKTTNLGGRRGPGRSKYSYVCHIVYGQVHTTHRKQGQAITPTLTMKPPRGLHCFPNCQAIVFHVGILPLTTASLLFLTIQLEPLAGMHAHTEASGDFLLSGNQTLKPWT